MLTRCPKCGTAFRVTAEQLKAKQGKVRCGECRHVFNAIETLVDDPDTVAKETYPPPTSGESSLPDAVFDIGIPDEPPLAQGLPSPRSESAHHDKREVTPPDLPEQKTVAGPPVLEQAEHRRRWPWILGSLFALASLSTQALMSFRTEIVTLSPASRPALEALCKLAGCQLTLPARIDMIGIEASDLIPDARQAGRFRLQASLRNRAGHAQLWPHLELTLTDIVDKAVLRRVMSPGEYLPKDSSLAGGFPPKSDLSVQLTLQSTDMPAAGYRLYVFYP